jgi:NAD(P)-dependent dehydrogenase (short-subunit alcohol dehydrogenase family)
MDLSAMQVALVTGAGSRLGQVLAKHLAKNGYMVVVHVNRSRDAGRKLVEEIVDGGHHAVMISCDFERSSSIVRFFEKVVRLHGLPHLIINNASVFKYDFPGKGSIELLDSSLAVHVKAPFILTELAYRKSRRGSAVTVVNVLITPSSRIRVFGVLPGLLFPSGKQTQRDFERVRNNTILGRNPRPEEVAEAILLLARNKSMPGQNLVIDGGESLVRRVRDIAYE